MPIARTMRRRTRHRDSRRRSYTCPRIITLYTAVYVNQSLLLQRNSENYCDWPLCMSFDLLKITVCCKFRRLFIYPQRTVQVSFSGTSRVARVSITILAQRNASNYRSAWDRDKIARLSFYIAFIVTFMP